MCYHMLSYAIICFIYREERRSIWVTNRVLLKTCYDMSMIPYALSPHCLDCPTPPTNKPMARQIGHGMGAEPSLTTIKTVNN